MRRKEKKVTHLSSQETPTTVLEEPVGILIDGLHDRTPVKIDLTFGDWYIDRTEATISSARRAVKTPR